MSTIQKISGIVITFNEEKRIKACIESLKKVVDEVIVIDSFSSDNTKSICKDLNVTFIENEWMGFSKTKNFANSKANHEYILSLDADEVLSEELIHNIKKLKKADLNPGKIYSFNRLNNYCGQWIKYAGWYPDKKVRLFEAKNTTWIGDVHEKLVFQNDVKTVHVSGDILHYSIENKDDHIARIHKYNKLANPYPNKLVALLAATSTFIKLYLIKCGFLEGKLGFQLCLISAKAKIWR
jgi:glycosyltransferase involved in cell wall biosynthesis